MLLWLCTWLQGQTLITDTCAVTKWLRIENFLWKLDINECAWFQPYLLLAKLIDWNLLVYLLSNHFNTWRWCVYIWILFCCYEQIFSYIIADLNKDLLECEYWFDKVFFFLYLNKWCIFFNMLNTKYQSLCWLRPKIITVSRSQTDPHLAYTILKNSQPPY